MLVHRPLQERQEGVFPVLEATPERFPRFVEGERMA
jgi:hypothetical protein